MGKQPRLYNLDVLLLDSSLPLFVIASASRCAEPSVFRFVFDAGDDVEASADLTVAWLEQDRCAWLRYIAIDRVYTRDRALAAAVEAWVSAHQHLVFEAALAAEAA